MRKATLATLFASLLSMGTSSASAFTISMVADNDYAIFGGTSTSITSLLYQNDVSWYTQVANISAQNFALGAGEDTFYVLAMDGGGSADISGEVNGVNITDVSVGAEVSGNVASALSGYNPGQVASGIYSVTLSMAQTALAAAGPFVSAQPFINTTNTVITSSGFGSGFAYTSETAVFYRFEAGDVNVSVPSTPSLALMALGLVGIVLRSRRRTLSR